MDILINMIKFLWSILLTGVAGVVCILTAFCLIIFLVSIGTALIPIIVVCFIVGLIIEGILWVWNKIKRVI